MKRKDIIIALLIANLTSTIWFVSRAEMNWSNKSLMPIWPVLTWMGCASIVIAWFIESED